MKCRPSAVGLEQQSTLCLLRLRKGCSQWQEQLVFIFCTSILDWKRVWGGGRQGQTHPLEIPKSLRAEQFLVSTCLWAAACARTLAAVSETTNPGKNWLVWGTVSQPGPWVCLQSLQWGFCSWLLGGAEGFFFWGGVVWQEDKEAALGRMVSAFSAVVCLQNCDYS